MTQAFLYKWTEKSTGKWYIGSRTANNCHPGDGYICSSKKVISLINENQNNWHRDVLVIGNPRYIYELEGKLLSLLDAKSDPSSFNKHNNDCVYSGKFVSFKKGSVPWNKGLPSFEQPSFGLTHSLENKKLFSEQKKGSKNPQYGKTPWNKGITNLAWYNNGSECSQYVKGEQPPGFVEGRIYLKKWYTNGQVNKQFIPGEVEDGFYPGRTMLWSTDYDKTQYKWYNNGVESKRFVPGTEPDGFVLGRKIAKRNNLA